MRSVHVFNILLITYFLEYFKMPVILVAYKMGISQFHNLELLEFYKKVSGLSETSLLRSFNISDGAVFKIPISKIFSSLLGFGPLFTTTYLNHVSLSFLKYAVLKQSVNQIETEAAYIKGVTILYNTIYFGHYSQIYSANLVNFTLSQIAVSYQGFELYQFNDQYLLSKKESEQINSATMKTLTNHGLYVDKMTFMELLSAAKTYSKCNFHQLSKSGNGVFINIYI